MWKRVETIFCSIVNLKLFLRESWKNQFPRRDFVGSEIVINSWRHQKLLLVANQLQDSTFFKKINSKDIGISKFVPQLKLLPILFELKDNGTVVMSTIIKKITRYLTK